MKIHPRLKRTIGAVVLGTGFAIAAVSAAAAFGSSGGGSGEQDSALRQELQNPSSLERRPTVLNYSRPPIQNYAYPPRGSYGVPYDGRGYEGY